MTGARGRYRRKGPPPWVVPHHQANNKRYLHRDVLRARLERETRVTNKGDKGGRSFKEVVQENVVWPEISGSREEGEIA